MERSEAQHSVERWRAYTFEVDHHALERASPDGVKLSHRRGETDDAMLEEIVAQGTPGLEALAALLTDPNPHVIRTVGFVLGRRGVYLDRVKDAFEKLLESETIRNNERAMKHLTKAIEEFANPQLLAVRPPEFDKLCETQAAKAETIGELRARFAASRWTETARALDCVVRPCLKIATTRVEQNEVPHGASRFGGLPDVPPGFVWPTNRGFAFGFIAQFDCSQIPTSLVDDGFPSHGTLYVFNEWAGEVWGADPADAGNWLVFHTRLTKDELVRMPYPDMLEQRGRFKPCVIETAEAVSYPNRDDPRFPADAIVAWYGEDALKDGIHGDDSFHQLGGYATSIQNVAEYAFARDASYAIVREPLDLLLEVITDAAPDWEWGDSGSLFYLFKRSELRALDFTSVRLDAQCH